MPLNVNQVLADIEARLSAVYGPTTLSNPSLYASDPLVQTQLPAAIGLSKLHDRFEAFVGRLTPLTAEGADLTAVAALMGQARRTGMPSYVPVVINGVSNSEVLGGTVLVDDKGIEWQTLETVQLGRSERAFTDAMSAIGAHDLNRGELRLQTPIPGVEFVTNAARPDVGGIEESDEALRRRLLGMNPHWRVKETPASIANAVRNVSGVLRAEYVDYPCDPPCKQKMIAVIGGSDVDIAQAIYDSAPFAVECCLNGESMSVVNCTEVRFQRMCPVIVKIRLWKDCRCSSESPDEGVANIVAKANKWGLEESFLSAKFVTNVTEVFTKAEFCLERVPLAPCATDQITDPVSGEVIEWHSDKISGVCKGHPACDCVWEQTANLEDFEYPIILPENITVMRGCPVPSGVGCGC